MKRRIMLDLSHVEETTRVTRALSSPLRLEILRLLIKSSYNITEIAQETGQPVSSIANHVRVLEEAELITTSERPGVRGSQKVCGIAFEGVYFNTTLPTEASTAHRYVYRMGIGRYFDCQVKAPCGLISEKSYLGTEDNPTVFYDNDRIYGQLLWLTSGYVEYRFPRRLEPGAVIDRLVFTMELCSEAPGYNNKWPSDITVSVNGEECAMIHSAGDYGGAAGALNPGWWPLSRTQYGMLHQVEVNGQGTFVDGVKSPAVSLQDLADDKPYISLRLEVKADAVHRGGMNLFGEKFGNYPQGIQMEMYTKAKQ